MFNPKTSLQLKHGDGTRQDDLKPEKEDDDLSSIDLSQKIGCYKSTYNQHTFTIILSGAIIPSLVNSPTLYTLESPLTVNSKETANTSASESLLFKEINPNCGCKVYSSGLNFIAFSNTE